MGSPNPQSNLPEIDGVKVMTVDSLKHINTTEILPQGNKEMSDDNNTSPEENGTDASYSQEFITDATVTHEEVENAPLPAAGKTTADLVKDEVISEDPEVDAVLKEQLEQIATAIPFNTQNGQLLLHPRPDGYTKSIAAIVACDLDGAIGKEGDMPWKMKSDLKFFKETTMGGVLIMGRKTFDSLPGVLPGRLHIVISRDANNVKEIDDKVVHAGDIETAIALAKETDKHVFICGGGEIYDQSLKYIDTAYITQIKTNVDSPDTYFLKNADGVSDVSSRLNELGFNHTETLADIKADEGDEFDATVLMVVKAHKSQVANQTPANFNPAQLKSMVKKFKRANNKDRIAMKENRQANARKKAKAAKKARRKGRK